MATQLLRAHRAGDGGPGRQAPQCCVFGVGAWQLCWGANVLLLRLSWVCPHVVIVQINAHSKLVVYFLKFNIVFVILKYLL